jgi:hypothetical protein
MSEQLKAFFEAYLEWAKTGDEHEVFEPYVGLCDNLEYYLAPDDNYSPEAYKVKQELIALLKSSCANPVYPFETKAQYHERNDLHKNHKRIAWVRKQLEK